MVDPAPIAITPAEQFEHLRIAPIVEAVIQLRARAEIPQKSNELKALLKEKLPEYSTVKSVGSVSVTVAIAAAGNESSAVPAQPSLPERAWHGLRLETEDARNVAMFTREHFSFSRLKPYDNWESFSEEALRLWTIHETLMGPSEIQRLGVRFINRLEVPIDQLDRSEYLRGLSYPPGGLESTGFFYRDNLSVPGHPYAATLVRTVQPVPDHPSVALLLDIDTYSQQPFPPDPARIRERLADLHWIKNRIFFDNVTEKALDLCR